MSEEGTEPDIELRNQFFDVAAAIIPKLEPKREISSCPAFLMGADGRKPLKGFHEKLPNVELGIVQRRSPARDWE